jgi:DNA-binding transcriptional ArsR family regulator
MPLVSLTIDISGVPENRVLFASSPLAELTAALHVLSVPAHHPGFQGWAAGTRAALKAELAERLEEAEFLWRSSRADFLLPGLPGSSFEEELNEVDQIPDEIYVHSALTTTCGNDRVLFGKPSPLKDPQVRERTLDLAEARGPRQAAFAQRLIADPPMVRARVRRTLEECGPAFFTDAWLRISSRLAADLRLKADLLGRRGLAETLAAVSPAVSLDHTGERIVIDKLQDNTTSALDHAVAFVPTVFGHPHLVTVHAPGWRPVVQYPIATGTGDAESTVPMELVRLRIEALAHPVRMRLIRTLARGAHTTSELASSWQLSAPEVSRHLAQLRKAGLLTAQRRGRYVLYELDLSTTAAIGTDLIEALLR